MPVPDLAVTILDPVKMLDELIARARRVAEQVVYLGRGRLIRVPFGLLPAALPGTSARPGSAIHETNLAARAPGQ